MGRGWAVSVVEMRREMGMTVATMREELGRVAVLDDEAEDAVARLRLHLSWLQGRFNELRRAEIREAAGLRASLLRAGDRSLELELGEVRA